MDEIEMKDSPKEEPKVEKMSAENGATVTTTTPAAEEKETKPAEADTKNKEEKTKEEPKEKKAADDESKKRKESSEENAATSSSARPQRDKRARKSSAAFVPDDFVHVNPSVKIIQGRGKQLSSIDNVRESIEGFHTTAAIVDLAHRFLFKRQRKPPTAELKKDILQFSGYLEPKNPELDEEAQKEYDEKAETVMSGKAYKLKVGELKELCDFFAIDRTKRNDKDSLVDCLLDFLGEPQEDLTKGKGKAASKTKGSSKKKKASKSKDDDDDDEEEEEDEEEDDEDATDSEEEDEAPQKKPKTTKKMKPSPATKKAGKESDIEPVVVNKGEMPSDATLRRWVKAFVICFDTDTVSVKKAIEIASEKFGVDMTPKKERMKAMLINELE